MSALPPTVAVPVICPKCGTESLIHFPGVIIATALLRWNRLTLFAQCHDGAWDATMADLARMREHVGEHWLTACRALIHPHESSP